MLTGQCYPPGQDASQWLYCPSATAAVLFSALFGVTTSVHCLQAALYHKTFAIVGIAGAVWETCGYVFRTLSVHDQLNPAYFDVQQLLLLLAPLWINAYVYMVLGRMAHFYLLQDKIFGLKARHLTLVFVTFDLTAFGVQAAGTTMAIIALTEAAQSAGLHVYQTGIALQIFFVVLFMVVSARFQILVREQDRSRASQSLQVTGMRPHEIVHPRRATWLLRTVYLSLFLIVYRNTYRAIEYSHGITSGITTHEWYTFVFDAMPMLLIFLGFNIFNPGMFLQGPRSDFADENRTRKASKKAKRKEQRNERLANVMLNTTRVEQYRAMYRNDQEDENCDFATLTGEQG